MFEWKPIDPAIESRIAGVLESWDLTPYVAGGGVRHKQVGTNCIGFMTAVLDELYGFERTPIARLPQDLAFRSPEAARKAMADIMAIYQPHRILVTGEAVEPMDVIVGRRPGIGPTHAILVGTTPGQFWEADKRDVHPISMRKIEAVYPVIEAIFRMLDKDRWA